MTSSLDDVFATALEKGSSEERTAYLDEACRDDPALRRQVERMLAAHAKAGSFLEWPAPEIDASLVRQTAERPGDTIGRYKLLEEIGDGGMGVVYMAEQREPVRRKVALKIIKPGMDTREVIARFEAERQALAMMDHPNIAKVFDAGETESGRPYFVMELVDGCRLTDYCDFNELTIRRRLELFVQVCQAMHHAHQKGIIHRDIKPSNVMVALYDSTPVPKIIDFGIAKAIHAPLTDRTFFTHFGQMIGTPLYMSPEQAELRDSDVDTRSDIYSLGVMLYELLTGSTPFDEERAKKAGYDEIRRMIREDEPQPPSTRVSTLKAADTVVFAQRKSDPARLGGLLRRDLDWIVMKALQKDRTRRYESASAFAADIERYLANEPIHARPPTLADHAAKWARRHRPLVWSAAVISLVTLAALTASLVLISGAYQRERQEHAVAVANAAKAKDNAAEAKQNAAKAEENAAKARNEAAIAQAVIEFINQDLLRKADPHSTPDRDLKVREVLSRAARTIQGKFADQPLVEAGIRVTLGNAFSGLGEYREAEPQYIKALAIRRRVLGEEHPDTLSTMNDVALLYFYQGRYAEAEPLYLKALEIQRCVLGQEDPNTITTMDNLACLYHHQGRKGEAEPLFLKTLELERRVLGQEHPHTLSTMNNLATYYYDQGRYTEAEPLLVKALEIQQRVLRQEHPDTLNTMNSLAMLYDAQGRYGEAELLFLKTLAIERRVLGERNCGTVDTMNNLAMLYVIQGRYAKAEPLLVESLAICRLMLSQEHPHTLSTMNNLAGLYDAQRRYDKAEPLYVKTMEIERRVLGEKHPNTLGTMNNLAALYDNQRRYAEAEPLFLKTLEIERRVLGEEHPDTLNTMNNLAKLYCDQGRYAESEQLYIKTLEIRRRVLGDEHPKTLSSMLNLAVQYYVQGRYAEAEPLCLERLQIQRRVLGEEHLDTLGSMSNLAEVYRDQGRYAEAEPLLLKTLEIQRRVLGQEHPDTRNVMINLTRLYLDAGRYEDAQRLSAQLLEISRRAKGIPDHDLAASLTLLGESRLGAGKHVEAEPVLRESAAIWERSRLDCWERYYTASLLGESLAGQGRLLRASDAAAAVSKFAEAEPLLLAGYEGLYPRRNTMPYARREKVISELLRRIVALTQSSGREEKAKAWEDKLISSGVDKPEAKKPSPAPPRVGEKASAAKEKPDNPK